MGAQRKVCQVVDLGRIGYAEAFALQQRLVAARKARAAPDVLLLCEHPHVLTLGRSGKIEHLRVSADALRQKGVEFHASDRGGDITYHGPGQIVGYPILQLAEIRRDVVWYVRQLEEAMICASAAFGVTAFRVPGCTGVWVRPAPDSATDNTANDPPESAAGNAAANTIDDVAKEKLGAIGVHISRWVTSHGFAYNVSSDLRYFDLIVPCGIAGCRTTSLEKLLRRPVHTAEVAPHLTEELGRVLGLEMAGASREELSEWLGAAELAAGGAASESVANASVK
jgi:lipoyl(octanoyl) transferase